MESARLAQQQQILARVWVPNSCPPMKVRHDGVLGLARGSAAMLQTLLALESTMLRLRVVVWGCAEEQMFVRAVVCFRFACHDTCRCAWSRESTVMICRVDYYSECMQLQPRALANCCMDVL